MTRLFINIGHNFRVRPQDFVGAIAGEANVPGRVIGAIDIHDTYSFVDVPTDIHNQVIEALNAASVKGRPVNVEVATAPAGGFAPRPNRGAPRPFNGPRGGGDRGGYGRRRDEEGVRGSRGFNREGYRPERRSNNRYER